MIIDMKNNLCTGQHTENRQRERILSASKKDVYLFHIKGLTTLELSTKSKVKSMANANKFRLFFC